MRNQSSFRRNALLSAAAIVFLLPPALRAQVNAPAPRITAAIDEHNLTILRGNTHPLARAENDRGEAAVSLPMERMLLVLRRSALQESALDTLMEQQQNAASPSFHKWLTPQQFGQQFGPGDQDIQTITAWLQSRGFQVAQVSSGRTVIEFSGTAGQVEEAFHTTIHKYSIGGKERWANSSDPQIPTALAPVVGGIATLHDFPRKPFFRTLGLFSHTKGIPGFHRSDSPAANSLANPFFTAGGGCGLDDTSCYALAPYDFATIYNVLPLWSAAPAIDGTGETIAIVAQSDIYSQDFADFRSDFGLPVGTLNIINNGPDPGKLASEGDETESDLDVEWSGSIAKGATIDFVVSATTNSSAGVDLSALYIVDNNLAPIMSESYGACELDLGTAGNQFYNQLWQQAAAEGITVLVATGDSGSAVCDRGAEGASNGLSVNGIASTPYNVAIGGTDFNDLQNPLTYWNTSNNPTTLASAKGYIPEMTWNDTCTNAEFFSFGIGTTAEGDCNDTTNSYFPLFLAPVGGSGGASNCITSSGQLVSSCSGGYAKPAWQAGAGVPNDRARDVPDIAMFAGDGLNAHFYVVCETDIYGGCVDDAFDVIGIGGTSAPTPAFAGVMALIDQQTQSRQGNANYVFYPLAAQAGASCNSSAVVGNGCIFYDVTNGTNAMPCVTGSPNCVTNTAGDSYGVLSGFATTAGYDLATGLGSVNVTNLVKDWTNVAFRATSINLTLNGGAAVNVTHGSPVNFNVTVAPQSGPGTPTGLVSLLTSNQQGVTDFTLSNAAVSGSTPLLPGGSYNVTARYAGDGTFGSSTSSPGVPVTVNSEPSSTTIQVFTLDQNNNSNPFASGGFGTVIYYKASVAGQSGEGVATGSVNFTQTTNGTTTNLPGDPFPLNAEGYTMSPLPGGLNQFPPPGTYSIAAAYAGDASFNPSASAGANFTITKGATTSYLYSLSCGGSGQAPCFVIFGSQYNVVSYVYDAASAFAPQPTGTLALLANGTLLGSPVEMDSSEDPPTAVLSTTQLPQGMNALTAQYSGDTNYAGSTSAAISVHVVMLTSLNLMASSTSISSGQSVTFTAQITPNQGGGPAPTGTVQFSSNGTNLGGAVAVAGGQAQLTTSSLTSGADQIAASYSGDVNYQGSSNSASVTVAGGTPTFTVTASPATIPVSAPGAAGTTVLTFTGINGFSTNGTVTLSASACVVLPSESGCSFNPPTISFAANGSAMTTLSIPTTRSSGMTPNANRRPDRFDWRNDGGHIALMTFACMLLLSIAYRRKQFRWSTALGLIAFTLLLGSTACGGGSGGGGGGGGNPGTPVGDSPITVTFTINGVTVTVPNLFVNVE